VNNGAAIVNWASGQLSVFALGEEIRDSNTVFAVVVDSAAGRAAVYVFDGVVTMSAGRIRATRNESLTFSTGAAPRLQPTPTSVAAEIQYHSAVAWRPPRRSAGRWKVWAGGAVALTATVVAIQAMTGDEDSPTPPKKGTVTFRLPL
jgi:hypothetical protein